MRIWLIFRVISAVIVQYRSNIVEELNRVLQDTEHNDLNDIFQKLINDKTLVQDLQTQCFSFSKLSKRSLLGLCIGIMESLKAWVNDSIDRYNEDLENYDDFAGNFMALNFGHQMLLPSRLEAILLIRDRIFGRPSRLNNFIYSQNSVAYECPICFVNINKGESVSNPPCHQSHIFHTNW
jgi:hypothetical protein